MRDGQERDALSALLKAGCQTRSTSPSAARDRALLFALLKAGCQTRRIGFTRGVCEASMKRTQMRHDRENTRLQPV